MGLLALLLPVVIGWILVSAAWPDRGADRLSRFVQLCLATGLGLGLTSCAFFVAVSLWRPSRSAAIGADLVLLMMAVVLFGLGHRGGSRSEREGVASDRGVELSRALMVGTWLAGLGAAAVFAFTVAGYPQGDWDAWAIWNLRARFIVRGGEHWRDGLSPLIAWSHPDYPLLLPATVARVWSYAKQEALVAPIGVAALFTGATMGLAASAVALLRGMRQGLVGALLLLGSPGLIIHGAIQYADLPQAFFVLAPLVVLCLLDRMPGKPREVAWLVGALLGLAAWVKNEGTLAMVAILVARVVVVARTEGWRACVRQSRDLAAGLAPVLLLVLYYRMRVAPPGDLLAAQGLEVTGHRLLDLTRYARIAGAFGREVLGLGGWVVSVVGVLAAYGALVRTKVSQQDRAGVATTATALGLMLAGFFGVYVVTPHPLEWHLNTSLSRLLLQLWPSGVFLYCLVVSPPGARAVAPG